MTQIVLDDVSLVYRVRRMRRTMLKEYIIGGLFSRRRNPIMEIRALDGLNLRLGEGDRLGIVGHNGAGKSSLLKLLAGVYPPSGGRAIVDGRISSMFDLMLGFQMDANGWDNIAFRGFLQGETPRSIREKKQEIAEFSELGEFMDMPIRYYSSGMLVRLAFSIATAIDPEILLLDEVLSAGDLAFQEKAARRMKELLDRASIIVMVSHDMNSIKNVCNRVLWLDHGREHMLGGVQEVVAAYHDSVVQRHREAA